MIKKRNALKKYQELENLRILGLRPGISPNSSEFKENRLRTQGR